MNAEARGRRLRRLNDIPALAAPVELVWRQPRYRCVEPACPRGGFSALCEEEVHELLSSSGLQSVEEDLLGTLLRSSFLGLETSNGHFDFFSDEPAQRRNSVLARKLTASRTGQPARYRIHPAFRPFLQIEDDDLPG